MLFSPILKWEDSLRVPDFLKNIERGCDKVGLETRPVGESPGPPRATATEYSPSIHLGPQSRGHVLINIINKESGRARALQSPGYLYD